VKLTRGTDGRIKSMNALGLTLPRDP